MLEEKERVKDTNYQNLSRQNDTGIAVYRSVSQCITVYHKVMAFQGIPWVWYFVQHWSVVGFLHVNSLKLIVYVAQL